MTTGRVGAPMPGSSAADGGTALPPDQVALGGALQSRAAEVAARVKGRWAGLSPNSSWDAGTIGDSIIRTCELATVTVGSVLVTGQMPSTERWKALAVVGKAAASDTISLAEMTKLYLYWRDISIKVLREEAFRLGTARAALGNAEAVVCAGCDASLVRMARQFDERRQQLQERLTADQARLLHLARHDALTGLPNRVVLFERLLQEVELARRHGPQASVLFVDLDGFKAVNDQAGHAAGDQVLIDVADRLVNLIRPTDIVTRLGGDEFVVLCAGLHHVRSQTRRVIARIEAGLSEPFPVNDQRLEVSASVGSAIVGPDDDPESLLSRADADMYAAKQRGAAPTKATT